ncbi:ParB/RepB/Spo0J family partition protein [Phaeobacter gallaeciensis]|uniref:ParB/RepB/Spo0J family partition protein n=1 Tax=Phaeobacter gallaeciensis TaxID=60890 RepID=UPI001C311AC3|nr:ParB/RepB/Spo0J family partition protein [Phaeobacter gallaeciensis]
MIKDQNPKIQQLPIADIIPEWDKRLRGVTDSGVESLVNSIADLGVMKDAIHVRRKGRGDNIQLVLMAGGHRLTAAMQLGWETIPARVWADITDDDALTIEIDDNLSGADLSHLELAVFLAEKKRVYERQHPEAKHGANGGRGGKVNEEEIISFSKSVAEKRELSPRHISNLVRIGNALSSREVAELSATQEPLKLKDLMALAKIGEPIMRSDIVGRLSSGEVKSVSEALEKIQPKKAKVSDLDGKALQALATAWSRAPMKVKRQFVSDESAALFGLLNDLDGKL